MASKEHLELSSYIKNVHSSLRKRAKEVGYKSAWQEHCNKENLGKYASAMKLLATEFWEKSADFSSRIQWVVLFCCSYFKDIIFLQREKEINILFVHTYDNILAYNTCEEISPLNSLLNMLDVGSCYNPFTACRDIFNITAIDIAPAVEGVFKCDFVNVSVGDETISQDSSIVQLKRESFHVVTFSLLLEYLPCPELRMTCCEKAYNLLKYEGLLIIITPDSKHVGANAKFMKSWKHILAKMGFSRVKYEKLQYLHCMAFRKSLSKKVPQRWAAMHEKEDLFSALHIPQDFQVNTEDTNTENCQNCADDYFDSSLMPELPFCTS